MSLKMSYDIVNYQIRKQYKIWNESKEYIMCKKLKKCGMNKYHNVKYAADISNCQEICASCLDL